MALYSSSAFASNKMSAWEEQLIEQAQTCNTPVDASKSFLRELLLLEKASGVPDHFRGIILAAACVESGYNPKAEGDHKFSKDKKTPVAIGLLQLWPWWEHKYKISRRNPQASAKVWLKHLNDNLAYVKRRCPPLGEAQLWSAAEAVTVRGPGKRCFQRTSHVTLLAQWQRSTMPDFAF